MQTIEANSRAVVEVPVQGICDERFTKVRDLFAAQLTTGADIGASAAVFSRLASGRVGDSRLSA